jgi:hypothetical protein
VTLDTVQFLVAGVAALGAGAVNAVAGGGTLISGAAVGLIDI